MTGSYATYCFPCFKIMDSALCQKGTFKTMCAIHLIAVTPYSGTGCTDKMDCSPYSSSICMQLPSTTDAIIDII